MKRFLLAALFPLAMICSAKAEFDLTPGKPFPPLALPSVSNGEKVEFREQLGEKLMLHLFASW